MVKICSYRVSKSFIRSRLKEDKTVISTVVNKKQYIKIKNYISNIDSKAFLTIGFVHNVHGEGF